MVAGVGDIVGVVLLQLLRLSDGGVGFTVRFIDAVPAVPLGVGVAVSVPL
jgi:hypothetical protein